MCYKVFYFMHLFRYLVSDSEEKDHVSCYLPFLTSFTFLFWQLSSFRLDYLKINCFGVIIGMAGIFFFKFSTFRN